MRRGIFLLVFSSFCSILNIFISKQLYFESKCILNEGVAFGISIEYIFLISILLISLLIILGLISREDIRYIFFSLAVLGLSNLIVRFNYASVCDYINILGISFNIADFIIVLIGIYAGVNIIFSNRR